MAGRMYEEVGAPHSEADERLIAKRKALMAVHRRRKNREGEYVSYPAPTPPEDLAAATRYIERRAGENAELLLDMLGLSS